VAQSERIDGSRRAFIPPAPGQKYVTHFTQIEFSYHS